jgi:hypothetical protein
LVPRGTKSAPPAPEIVRPLTPELHRLNVTVSEEFLNELEQVRAVLSHKYSDGNFDQVVREAFKLVLERDRKNKAHRVSAEARGGESPGEARSDEPQAGGDQGCRRGTLGSAEIRIRGRVERAEELARFEQQGATVMTQKQKAAARR